MRVKTVSYLLRASVAFPLLYVATSAFMNPNAWIGFFPVVIQNTFSAGLLLGGFGIFQVILAFLILFMKSPFYPAVLTAALMFGIVVFNFAAFDIVFRDISILLVSVTLAILYKDSDSYKIKDH